MNLLFELHSRLTGGSTLSGWLNVDAPEKGQKGAPKARNFLKDLILDKEVSIDTKARDKYRRSVANVKVGPRSVNKAVKDNLS